MNLIVISCACKSLHESELWRKNNVVVLLHGIYAHDTFHLYLHNRIASVYSL